MTVAPERLTRRQLYDLVWKTPVDDLAPRFGLSGRGLGKLCERNAIPVPPRGYWARKAAGQKIARPPLIEFERPNGGGDAVVLVARARAHEAPPSPTPFLNFYNEQLAEIGKVPVLRAMRDPHPMIAAWIADDESDQKRFSYPGRTYRSAYNAPLARRRLRILSALYRALEAQGFRVERDHPRRNAFVTYRHHRYDIDLAEKVAQKRRELTDQERIERYAPKQQWAFTMENTGLLRLRIRPWTPAGVPSDWLESAEAPLEEKLHEVVAALLACAAAQQAKDDAEQRDREARAEAERQAQLKEEAREREIERHKGLVVRAQAWRDAQAIRAYVEAVVAVSDQNDDSVTEWKDWALSRADALDPITAGDALSTEMRPAHGRGI